MLNKIYKYCNSLPSVRKNPHPTAIPFLSLPSFHKENNLGGGEKINVGLWRKEEEGKGGGKKKRQGRGEYRRKKERKIISACSPLKILEDAGKLAHS